MLTRHIIAAAALAWLASSGAAAQPRIHSYATVNDDATLQVRGKTVRLYGVHIPPTGRTCSTTFKPVRCGRRAALALAFKIQGFVECKVVGRYRDRSLLARCENDGQDLGAYLIARGWALALPGAPFAYQALERIARQHSLGVWGSPADRITRRQ